MSVSSQEAAATPTVGNSETAEKGILRAQLTEMKRSDERLLTTVLWTLTTCGGIVVILVSYSWFVNFKVYERDKESLKQDLAVAIRKDSESTKESLEKELKVFFEKRLAQIESRLNAQFSSLRKGILLTMYWDLERVYEDALERQNPLAVVMVVTTLLSASLEREDEELITTSLDRLRKALQQAGVEPPSEQVAKIDGLLNRLPDRFGADRDALRSRLRKLRG